MFHASEETFAAKRYPPPGHACRSRRRNHPRHLERRTSRPAAIDSIKAFKLCTGADNNSHVLEGTIDQSTRNDVTAIHFKQTPAHASYGWHNDPEPQYVMTLSGTLAFVTRGGEKFTLHPGEVLIAEDNTGTGHRWNLVDDQPWRRGYVVLKPGAPDSFIPNDPAAAKVCKGS